MRRLRPHLRRPRPAPIAATLAFFLAVGGVGYAVTGSGTFQKENEVGIDNPGPEVVRTIAGIGDIRTMCDVGDPQVLLHNGSGETLQTRLDIGNTLDTDDELNDGETTGFEANSDEILQFHAFPADGSKSPQADIAVSVDHTGNCATTQVAVISVTTTSSGSGTVAGSGTVQKGALENLPSSPTIVRSITGVGNVQANCNSGEPVIGVANTSGETLRAFRDDVSGFAPSELADNGSQFSPIDGDQLWRIHLFPANGSKAPQADITISVDDTNVCSTSQVSVLAVTTEQ